MQLLVYYPLKLLLKTVYSVKVKGPKGLVLKKRPILILANHPTRIDPILLTLLPHSLYKQIMPVYFMTSNVYYDRWWIRIFIRPTGAYRIRKWDWNIEKMLEPTKQLLADKRTVMIFPEGRLTKTKRKAKPGVDLLLREEVGEILLMKIEHIKKAPRSKLCITWMASKLGNTQRKTEEILEEIYEL